jgi:hypothetical protein
MENSKKQLQKSQKMANKKNDKYPLPSVDGIDVIGLLSDIRVNKNKVNTPPPFNLEIGVPANNIAKQLKEQNITFDPSVIKRYDKLIKSIVLLKKESFLSNKKANKLISDIYERSVQHVSFIYEIM